jgi:signal transduction histidine kinase
MPKEYRTRFFMTGEPGLPHMDASQNPTDPPEDEVAVEETFDEIFAREGREMLLLRLRLGLGVGVTLYVLFSALDWVAAPQLWWEFLVIRLATAFLTFATIGLSFTPLGRRLIRPISATIMYIGALGLIMMTQRLGGFGSNYFIGIMLALFLVGLFLPWGVKLTAIYCLAVLATYATLNADVGAPTFAEMLMPNFFLFGTCLLTCWASWAVERSRREGLSMRMQLEAANEGLKELDKAKTGFFANVSHELRTPLMLILGPLESLMRGDAGNPAPLLNAMNANAHRLLRQVNTILNFSKLEAGRQECNRELGQVATVLDQLVSGAAPYAEERGIKLAATGLDDLPEIPHDPEQVETAVANLMSNAMKFTPDGGSVTINAGLDEQAQRLWIEVADTGCGIPQKDIEKVFERFHQVDGGKGGKIQGTGLGLALSKELMELHGGTMNARSAVGEGTTFRIELPTLEASDWEGSTAQDPNAEKKEVQTVSRLNSDATKFADIHKSDLEDSSRLDTAPDDAPLLLVVEDNPDMRAFISQSLARRYRVVTAADGQLGLEAARRHRPDMIVSDVQMPNMDGFEMVENLRRDKTFDKTPIVMLTAKTGSDAAVKGLRLGAVDYINKPFKLAEIEARIEAQLRMARFERTLDERDSRLVAVGQMTGTIAHDMRGPLTAIFNRIELLRMMSEMAGNLDDFDGDLSAIEDTVRRVNNMIQELLEFVRGNNVTLDKQTTGVLPFLDKLVEEQGAALEHVDVQLVREHEGDRDASFRIDRDRITRVIENLINNSRDALVNAETEDPKVWLRTVVTADEVLVRIADNGPGIPEELRKKMFKPFATAGKANGTGLGLTIVKNLATAHDGNVEVDFAPPEGGAAFELTLPRQVSESGQQVSVA